MSEITAAHVMRLEMGPIWSMPSPELVCHAPLNFFCHAQWTCDCESWTEKALTDGVPSHSFMQEDANGVEHLVTHVGTLNGEYCNLATWINNSDETFQGDDYKIRIDAVVALQDDGTLVWDSRTNADTNTSHVWSTDRHDVVLTLSKGSNELTTSVVCYAVPAGLCHATWNCGGQPGDGRHLPNPDAVNAVINPSGFTQHSHITTDDAFAIAMTHTAPLDPSFCQYEDATDGDMGENAAFVGKELIISLPAECTFDGDGYTWDVAASLRD